MQLTPVYYSNTAEKVKMVLGTCIDYQKTPVKHAYRLRTGMKTQPRKRKVSRNSPGTIPLPDD